MLHAITLDALRAIDAIDQKGSFAAAAEALFKVPSALTYTIKKLEEEMGVELFDRSRQRAKLTPAGKLVLNQGRDILMAAKRLEDSVQQLESGWESEFTIARDTVIPLKPLLTVVNEFQQLDQRVNLNLKEESLGGGWDALHGKRADIVIGVSGELPKGLFETRKIGELEFIFVVAPDHPLADFQKPVEAEQFMEYPAVVVADSSRFLPVRDSGLFNTRQMIRVDSMQAKIEAQMLGLGIGFVPRHLAQPWLDSGALVEKACSLPRPNQTTFMAWHKGAEGKAMKWFQQALEAINWLV